MNDKCPLDRFEANPQLCIYVDCPYAKERLCDWPYRKGVMPMHKVEGAFHLNQEEENQDVLSIRITARKNMTNGIFLTAEKLLAEAKKRYWNIRAKEN